MSHAARTMLLSGAAVAAAMSLMVGSMAAHDDEESTGEIASMAPVDQMAPGLQVMDAWARESPMLELAGAAYMIIHSNTDTDDALIGVSSPAAEFAELHLSSMDTEGMMSMNQVPEIPIPAHADAVLKPGSYHVMLVNLVQPLAEGTAVELSLEFRVAEPQTVSVPVTTGMPLMAGTGIDDVDDMSTDKDSDEMDEESEG